MGWYIHHVNLQAYDVPEAAAFYRDIIGLEDGVWVYPDEVGDVGHNPDSIAAFGSLNRGLHVVRAIPDFTRRNKLFHNPTIGGHVAITVPDADAVKTRLEAAGTTVSDAGVYAMAGMRQLYAYDPFQHVVEVNEAVDNAAGPAPGPDEQHGVREEAGGWSIHHVTLAVHDVALAASWFRGMIGLPQGRWQAAEDCPVGDVVEDPAAVAVFGRDNRGLHLVKPVPDFARRNGFDHNPTIGGHVALTVADLDGVIARLSAAGILFTDAGTYAMAGMRQVYVYDPSMNLVELNQPVG